ncbi:uncharacterized protein LOC126884199 [Diabrotica virgifera virgifera]|uniref:DNA-directed DNA polymerase n=1 Tax=Diabrotica virgifera virgifera TaxID=50390 RepID=A0ABM5K758_DIAVI|nr:uncharacterized protein LOC126884199 [Diabrotica virgifera virgifera]XP_050506023.1 uncharacterized protein LOC126884199 [Diabrotica virgifera virgifera]XP_050506024.1 uncharacterized protein LOC126884199 [Diabrotica virgifera virgifera]
MKPKQRDSFLQWHADKVSENYIFDFQKEIREYCDADVDILRRGCLELRKEFLAVANIDCFQYVMIASTCLAIYRSKYLPTNQIAVVEKQDVYSSAAISWLSLFPGLRHARNGGEVTICGSKVDGFDKDTNTAYQFHESFWHGDPRVYSADTVNPVTKERMGDLYANTLRRSQQIRGAGYNLVEMWELDWINSVDYKKVEHMVKPLQPRDAFYGGRTNATKLLVYGKKLRHIDVVSLYPTVQFYDAYPVGHPIKLYKPAVYDSSWFGLILCTVLPPRQLYHHVLPLRTTKLLFPLCKQCVEDMPETCLHTEAQRSFSGTWTTLEMSKALEKGYKIINIHEVWHFEKTSRDLFKGYVKDFMKIKLESSSHTYESSEEYARVVKEQIGIELDLAKIAPNPGRRAVTKMSLVSLWGKLGQRLILAQSEYITTSKRWYEILLDDTLDITNCLFFEDTIVQVTYRVKEQFVENSNDTNVFIAAFTTSNARLRLYDMLDKLGEAVEHRLCHIYS